MNHLNYKFLTWNEFQILYVVDLKLILNYTISKLKGRGNDAPLIIL